MFYVVIPAVVATTTNETSDEFVKSRMENGRFVNSFNPHYKLPTFGQVLVWKFTSKNNRELPRNKKELDKMLPIIRHNKPEDIYLTKPGLRYIWIGHASCYVQMNNFRFLTDPVFR
jgi:hypothetical protein